MLDAESQRANPAINHSRQERHHLTAPCIPVGQLMSTDAKFLEGAIDAGFQDQKGMEDTEGCSLVILARRRSGQILAQQSNGWPSSMVQPLSPPNYRSDKVHQLARPGGAVS